MRLLPDISALINRNQLSRFLLAMLGLLVAVHVRAVPTLSSSAIAGLDSLRNSDDILIFVRWSSGQQWVMCGGEPEVLLSNGSYSGSYSYWYGTWTATGVDDGQMLARIPAQDKGCLGVLDKNGELLEPEPVYLHGQQVLKIDNRHQDAADLMEIPADYQQQFTIRPNLLKRVTHSNRSFLPAMPHKLTTSLEDGLLTLNFYLSAKDKVRARFPQGTLNFVMAEGEAKRIFNKTLLSTPAVLEQEKLLTYSNLAAGLKDIGYAARASDLYEDADLIIGKRKPDFQVFPGDRLRALQQNLSLRDMVYYLKDAFILHAPFAQALGVYSPQMLMVQSGRNRTIELMHHALKMKGKITADEFVRALYHPLVNQPVIAIRLVNDLQGFPEKISN